MNVTVLPKITFVSRISKMGDQKIMITVPSDFRDEIEPFRKMKQIKVTVEEAYD